MVRGSVRLVELRSEEWLYNLTLGGRPAGSQRLSTGFERGLFVMRLEAQFQGALGSHKRSQVSRLEPHTRLPAVFTENDNGRVFEATFDRRDGLVRVRQHRDEATAALTQDYHDPVSLLQYLRELPHDVRSARVPMIGGTVLVTRLDDETVDSPWGPRLARVYYLRPGLSLVYIEMDAPQRVLKLTQGMGKLALEAHLSRVSEGSRVTSEAPRERDEARGRERDAQPTPRSRRAARRERLAGRGADQRPDQPPRVAAAKPAHPAPEQPGNAESGSRSRRRRRNRGKSSSRLEGGGAVEAAPQRPLPAPKPAPEGAEPSSAGARKRRRRRRGKPNGAGSAE